VSQNGTVQNRLVEADEELAGHDLTRMANYLNELLQGLTLGQVKQRLLAEMRSEKTMYDTLLARALRLSQQTIGEFGSEVFIEGQANILEQPEFADVTLMQEIFRTFEEKGQLLSLLDRCLAAQGINIFIGAETHLNRITGMSLITSTYMTGKNTFGVLGVIGPTRMGYAKVIPIVDYTARLVSKLLEVE
jgi:heat-inducible transcriptional repressor